MSGVSIKEDGVHLGAKWHIHKAWKSTDRHPLRYVVVSSQRCCLWRVPTWEDAFWLVDTFEWLHLHPQLEQGLKTRMPANFELIDYRASAAPKTFIEHLGHMRNGVVFPMMVGDVGKGSW